MKRFTASLLFLTVTGAAQAQEAPICTDRPTKANAVCTVPTGALQIETNALGWTLTEASGGRSELLTVASSVAKIGLTGSSDLQIGVTPFARAASKAGAASDRVTGFGDILVRYKRRVTSPDAPVQVAVIPSVKFPTASDGLGNGKIEGGLALPISFALAGSVTMTLGPELNLLADANGSERHPAVVNLLNLSRPIAPRWTLVGELWTNINFDPAGTVQQASADAAVVYAVSSNLQLDAGANLGLTADTPDLEFYAGLSVRF